MCVGGGAAAKLIDYLWFVPESEEESLNNRVVEEEKQTEAERHGL